MPQHRPIPENLRSKPAEPVQRVDPKLIVVAHEDSEDVIAQQAFEGRITGVAFCLVRICAIGSTFIGLGIKSL